MPPGKPVGLLEDLKDTRPITISSTRESSSSGHPVDRNGAYKKRKLEPKVNPAPGTSFTLAQLKDRDEAQKAEEKRLRNQMARRKANAKKGPNKKVVKGWKELNGPKVVEYMRAPQRPPTKVDKWLLIGFEEEWKKEQEDAWAAKPLPAMRWGNVEEWTRMVCDALELWIDDV